MLRQKHMWLLCESLVLMLIFAVNSHRFRFNTVRSPLLYLYKLSALHMLFTMKQNFVFLPTLIFNFKNMLLWPKLMKSRDQSYRDARCIFVQYKQGSGEEKNSERVLTFERNILTGTERHLISSPCWLKNSW